MNIINKYLLSIYYRGGTRSPPNWMLIRETQFFVTSIPSLLHNDYILFTPNYSILYCIHITWSFSIMLMPMFHTNFTFCWACYVPAYNSSNEFPRVIFLYIESLRKLLGLELVRKQDTFVNHSLLLYLGGGIHWSLITTWPSN